MKRRSSSTSGDEKQAGMWLGVVCLLVLLVLWASRTTRPANAARVQSNLANFDAIGLTPMEERALHVKRHDRLRNQARTLTTCATLFVGLSANDATAQVNTDTLRPGPPREGLSGGLDGSFMQLGGNVGLLDMGLGGRVQTMKFAPLAPGGDETDRAMQRMVYLMGSFRYTARDTPKGTQPIVNQALLHARFIHLWHRRLGSAIFVQHQFNEFQRLRVRSIWGTSLSSPLVHTRLFNLQFGSGYMFEYNRISVFPGASDPETTYEHRWSNFLGARLSLFGGRLLSQNTIYMQPRWDKLTDFRFLEELEVLGKVNDMIGFGVTLSFLYDSAPPTGVKNTDTRISSNIRLSF